LGFTRLIRRSLEQKIRPAIRPDDTGLESVVGEVSEHIGIILSEGERLTTLINNLLDLDKIEAGKMSWDVGPVDVADIIARAAAATSSLYAGKGLYCEIDVDADAGVVLADREGVGQVLVDRMSKAVKQT